MSKNYHPYHMVELSPWPFTGACGAMTLAMGLVMLFHGSSSLMVLCSLVIIIITMYQWWRDIVRESTYQGLHSSYVMWSMRWGMILFIISEVLFFFSFFWAFFHSSLSPYFELGGYWPPYQINVLNPLQVPLLNTSILLASGVTVTWAHHSLMSNKHSSSMQSLLFTVLLGLYFTLLQAMEYYDSSFTIADSVYGATFFVATGFHGLHVIIGTSFLMICLYRMWCMHYSSFHHFGFEAAAWYWHFVDVVWLFLYIMIYWWGS